MMRQKSRSPLLRSAVFARPRIGHRLGFTIIEMIGTCALLGILFSITVPMFLVVAKERRSAEQRQVALQHAMNLLEQPMTHHWEELEPGDLGIADATVDLKSLLPGLERTLIVKQIEGELPARQVVASVRWQGTTGQTVSPIQVSAWVYPRKEAR